jgi:HTH-type transcriptional regulator/antitoxin HigA
MNGRVPAEVFPPGEFIRDELEARQWTQADLAAILGRPVKTVNELLAGKKSITAETAKGLADAFGTDAQFWMNLESAHKLSKVKHEGDVVSKRARLYGAAPIKDMIRRQWINSTDDPESLERELLNFFGVRSLDEIAFAPVSAAPRMSTDYGQLSTSQSAWLCRVKTLAATMRVSSFRPDQFDQMLAELLRFTSSEKEARRIPRLLADFGIRVLIVEHLPKTRIDGAALWLDSDSPVVAASLRFDRIDSFWHTLVHELGHIFYQDYRESGSVDNDIAGDEPPAGERPECEVRADQFACDHLVPRHEIDAFIARVQPLYSKVRINQFANRIGVHPGIIIGQLQRRGEIKYSHGREMLVKIRDIVTQSTLTDGWGHYPSL